MKILNNEKGFTLMEVLIVVIVIAILSMVASPYYKDHLERQKAASAISTLRMFTDSMERYMALHNETPTSNLSLLDMDIDKTKLGGVNNSEYSDSSFTYRLENYGSKDYMTGRRNTGLYTLYFSLEDDSNDAPYLFCKSNDADICENKLRITPLP